LVGVSRPDFVSPLLSRAEGLTGSLVIPSRSEARNRGAENGEESAVGPLHLAVDHDKIVW